MKEIEKAHMIREKLAKVQGSPFRTYVDLTVGQSGFFRFLVYELLTSLLGPIPGGLGFYLRKNFYPGLFKKVGTGLILGRNVVIRHPDKIEMGDNVTIDDNCVIDGRGAGSAGVVLEDNVIVNRNSIVLAKAGPIRLGRRANVGSNSVIVSMDGVELGEAALLAGGCYVSAGAYHFEDVESAVMDQGMYAKGPIIIGANAWLGTGVVVLDGVTIGDGAVIGACALVNRDIPTNAVAFGVPARVQRIKGEKDTASGKMKVAKG